MQYLAVVKTGVDFMSSAQDGKEEYDKALDAQAAGVSSYSSYPTGHWKGKKEKEESTHGGPGAQYKGDNWKAQRSEAERWLRTQKRQKEENGSQLSEDENWKLRNYERMKKNEEEEDGKDGK